MWQMCPWRIFASLAGPQCSLFISAYHVVSVTQHFEHMGISAACRKVQDKKGHLYQNRKAEGAGLFEDLPKQKANVG